MYRYSSAAVEDGPTGLVLNLADSAGVSVQIGDATVSLSGLRPTQINCGFLVLSTVLGFPALGANEVSTPAGVVGALSKILSSGGDWTDESSKTWVPVFLDDPEFTTKAGTTYSIAGGVMYLSLGTAGTPEGDPDRLILKGSAISEFNSRSKFTITVTTESRTPLTKWAVFVEEA